jgi:DMSO/TMAO reductase YedYZ molybdopterin-dependent catalytic subunit
MADAPEPLSIDPFVRPTPLATLEQQSIPTELHFRRDHFPVPELDPATWTLSVTGDADQSIRLTLGELKALPFRTVDSVLECAGHRRSEFQPPAPGVAWSLGALAEARWGGAALADVLALVGVPQGATVAVLTGADRGHFEDEPEIVPFARALPLAKALHPDTLVAWEMNGQPLPVGHGAPLRAIVPGWYATDSVKWLVSIELSGESFDGPFEARDYRLPDPESGTSSRMTSMPVHSIVTSPSDGAQIPAGGQTLRGIAWGGGGGIARVEVSLDGAAWTRADLAAAAGAYGLTHWSLPLQLGAGPHELAVRATDGSGASQPERPTWNPRGYGNASIHRIRVLAG